MIGSAIISPCGLYRYFLFRSWKADPAEPDKMALFGMMNPSEADAVIPDPTLRRCVGLTKGFDGGYNCVGVVNPFAYRTPYPEALEAFTGDRVGPDNDKHIAEAAAKADLVIFAWGARLMHRQWFRDRLERFKALLLADGEAHYLAKSKEGHERHPLMLPSCEPGTTTPLQPKLWSAA